MYVHCTKMWKIQASKNILSNQPTRITWHYDKCCWKPYNSSASVYWLIGQLASSLLTPVNFNTTEEDAAL